MKKSEEYLHELWETNKRANIHIMEVLEGEEDRTSI